MHRQTKANGRRLIDPISNIAVNPPADEEDDITMGSLTAGGGLTAPIKRPANTPNEGGTAKATKNLEGNRVENTEGDPKLISLKNCATIHMRLMKVLETDDIIENHETLNTMIQNYVIHKDPKMKRKTAFESLAKFKEFAKPPLSIKWTEKSLHNLAKKEPTIEVIYADGPTDVYLTNAVYRFYRLDQAGGTLTIFYFGDTLKMVGIIEKVILENQLKVEDIRQGVSLGGVSIEQFRACFDSSGMTVAVRSDGTRTKKSRREEQGKDVRNKDILFSSESTLSNNMAGFSLPGRLQKSIRVDLGVGISIEDALLSSIKLQRRENQLQVDIARNNLNSAISFCRSKMHRTQVALLSKLQDVKLDPQTKSTYCAFVSSTIDAIPPTQNKPVLIHPCFYGLIPEDNWKNAKSVYDLNLVKNVDFTTSSVCYEGFIDAAAMAQCLAMAMCNNVYGPLDLVSELFSIGSVGQRADIIGPLKEKLCCVVPKFKLKIENVTLNNYNRGVGTESKHQVVLSSPVNLKEDVHKPFLHRISLTRGGSVVSGVDPRKELLDICRNPAKIEEEKRLMNATNNATKLDFTLNKTLGFFNTIVDQELKDSNAVLEQWKEVAVALANKSYNLADMDF